MANSTVGVLYARLMRAANSPLSGAGTNRMYRTSDFASVVNGNWMRGVSQQPTGVTAPLWIRTTGPFTDAYNGTYRVVGTTKLAGAPYPAQVCLYPEAAPALCVRSATTGADGAYSFTGLAPGRYTVMGIDLADAYNNVVIALVTAVP